MSTERYSNVGKGGIVKEGIFVRFPDLAPAGTDNYWNSKTHGKLIIVGESNYFEDDVAFGLENLGIAPEKIRERVDLALDAVNMSDYKNFAPKIFENLGKLRDCFL